MTTPLRRSATLLALASATVVLAHASAASAATCSDYSNQAAAQQAKDTRDADGDGVYCESLPCPCATGSGASSGGGASTPVAKPSPKPRAKLGTPVFFAPRTKRSGCKVRGPLPDPACTPGAYYPRATPRRICVSGYTKAARNVSESTKRQVYASYGITSHSTGQYEIDHLVPLELGGSNSIANLFPEAAAPRPGFHEKDQVENRSHSSVCNGRRTLRATQKQIAKDWTVLFAAFG